MAYCLICKSMVACLYVLPVYQRVHRVFRLDIPKPLTWACSDCIRGMATLSEIAIEIEFWNRAKLQ